MTTTSSSIAYRVKDGVFAAEGSISEEKDGVRRTFSFDLASGSKDDLTKQVKSKLADAKAAGLDTAGIRQKWDKVSE